MQFLNKLYAKKVEETPHNIGEFYMKIGAGGEVLKAVAVEETDPTVPVHVKNITAGNINDWNNKVDRAGDTMTGDLVMDAGISSAIDNYPLVLMLNSTEAYFGSTGRSNLTLASYSNPRYRDATTYYDLWHQKNLPQSSIDNWNTAYGWGDHTGLYADVQHKYHVFNSNESYNDDYFQKRYLRLFTENASSDIIRFRAPGNVEYFDGVSWIAWTGGDDELKKLLDGNQSTGFTLSNTYRRFRFTITKISGWPTQCLFVLQNTWTNNAWPGATVIIENHNGTSWVEKENFGIASSNGHGIHLKALGNLHDGNAASRITVEINDFSTGTLGLRRLMLLSNYTTSRPLDPWSVNFDRKVSFEKEISTGLHGDSSQWNTSFGWGDHAGKYIPIGFGSGFINGSSGDLNDLRTGTVYAATSALNKPGGDNTHILSLALSSDYIFQLSGRAGKSYVRYKEVGVWSAWDRLMTFGLGDDRYVQKTGDTMTGMLALNTGLGEVIKIHSTSLGAAATGWMAFTDSANVRQGYIGMASGANSDLVLYSDTGNLNLTANSSLIFKTGGSTTRTTINSTGATMSLARISGEPSIKSLDSWLILEGGQTTGNAALNYYSTGDVFLGYGGGKAGVGVNAATSKLTVAGSIGATNQGRFGGWNVVGDMSGPALETGFVSGNGRILAYDRSLSTYLPIAIGNTNQLYLDPNGNIGIGTNIPGYLLDMQGGYLRIGSGVISGTTASRTSTSSWTVLTASGMNDHRLSGDHDGRYVNKTGDTITGQISVASMGTRDAGMYGIYSSTLIGHVWSMGIGYSIPADGSTFGTIYGMAYKHTNNTTGGTMAGGHQLVVCSNGTPGVSLGMAGGIWTTGDVIAFASSDRRLKDNIRRIENPLEKISRLGGYSFRWNSKQEVHKGDDYGVIAQEVEGIMPEIVTDRATGYKAVKYEKLIPLLIESIKALKDEIDILKNRP